MTKAVEVLGERWTLLIVRDMLLGSRHFNELARGLPGISRALLTQRLRQLERGGIIERHAGRGNRASEYWLTPAGQELQGLVDILVDWGARWAFGEPGPGDLDPVLLLWWMRGRIHRERFPPRQVVLQFDFRGGRVRTLWLVVDRNDVSVCLQHPGYDIDVLVTADIAAFYRIWYGQGTLSDAMRRDLVQLYGPPRLVRAFAGWFAWSPIAETMRAARRPANDGSVYR